MPISKCFNSVRGAGALARHLRLLTGALFLLLALPGFSYAQTFSFVLESEITVPPADAPNATGTGTISMNPETGEVTSTLTLSGTTGQATAAHVHMGAVGEAGPVVVVYEGNEDGTVWTLPEGVVATEEQLQTFNDGELYINVHTEANPAGELRAQLDQDTLVQPTTLTLALSPDITVPVAEAPGASGTGTVTVDTVTGSISGSVSVFETTGQPTAAHVHQGAAGEAGPVVLLMTGNEDGSIWSIPDGSTLDAAGIESFNAGNLYINVHTQANPAGELRAQLSDAGDDDGMNDDGNTGDDGTGTLGLTGSVYSSSALEFFWIRQEAAVAYRVELAGSDTVQIDGTSFFVGGLNANTTADVTVTALDGSNNALTTQSLQLTTNSDDFTPGIAVENLRGEVYSISAVELFWEVSDGGAGQQFVITRDGVEVGMNDGRSFFEEGLASGTTYTYTVTPQVGESATIELTTQGGGDGGPSGALGLSGQVYSVSALEIFWQRVDGATSYRVERNGEQVTEFDALSLFESELASDTLFQYTVSAVAADGSVISTETVELRTL